MSNVPAWIWLVGALGAVVLVGVALFAGRPAPGQTAWSTLGTQDVHSRSNGPASTIICPANAIVVGGIEVSLTGA